MKNNPDSLETDLVEGKNTKIAGESIPREPEKSKLRGHRSKITRVAFHPVYT